MEPISPKDVPDFHSRFKIFHDLMPYKVNHILLISTPYDAWIMEEDCRLSERIVHQYRGLNLSHPPRLTWASTQDEALSLLSAESFDLVIAISPTVDPDAYRLGEAVKGVNQNMPVVLLTHQETVPEAYPVDPELLASIDRIFYWSGDAEILLAIVKCIEDQLNVHNDTACASIRVILLVEDSPLYLSSLLSILYRELVKETQAVIEEGINEEHRLLSMRARPKILVADSYESALSLYQEFKSYVLGVISDVRYPRNCRLDGTAGLDLLQYIKDDQFDIPLLLTSSEPHNAALARRIPAVFVDKNSPILHAKVRAFLFDHMGFDKFVFQMPDGTTIGTATDLYDLEKKMGEIPEESFLYHCQRNDFSRYLFSLAEIELANRVRPLSEDDFEDVENYRRGMITILRQRRMQRQKGVIVNFDAKKFDPDTEFLKIGKGSLGGKARGLAFMVHYLHHHPQWLQGFKDVRIVVPQTLVITTEAFDDFIALNKLKHLATDNLADEEVADRFLAARFPEWLKADLKNFMACIGYPIAVRSSALMEDAKFKAYAGLYKTYMLANDHQDVDIRIKQLGDAVKLVFASTYYKGPKAFSRRVGQRTEEEKMAVIIQQATGKRYADFYYPDLAGIAQSYNFYPFDRMKPEEGIAAIGLGLGKTVMDGESALRFSPRHPQIVPQHASVDDILKYSQNVFYAVKMNAGDIALGIDEKITLAKRELADAMGEPPLRSVCSTYSPAEDRIRDGYFSKDYPVVTFSRILKGGELPLAAIIETILKIGQTAMGCPVEMEFSVTGVSGARTPPEFAILQIRPMIAREELSTVMISDHETVNSICRSSNCLGNGLIQNISDIIYVKPDAFDPAQTLTIAEEIGKLNAQLVRDQKKYLLIGPGRWGSADRWLGIPVKWQQIDAVGAMIESTHRLMNAEPSQGSHFFHNITSLGIFYMNVDETKGDHIDWQWVYANPVVADSRYVTHVRLHAPILIKIDGKSSKGIILTRQQITPLPSINS